MLSLQQLQKQREEKGLEIANNGGNQVSKVNDSSYTVLSPEMAMGEKRLRAPPR